MKNLKTYEAYGKIFIMDQHELYLGEHNKAHWINKTTGDFVEIEEPKSAGSYISKKIPPNTKEWNKIYNQLPEKEQLEIKDILDHGAEKIEGEKFNI